jgi:hypothetical protein
MTSQDDRTPHWRRSLPWWQRGAGLVTKHELVAALASLQAQVDELRLQVERLEGSGASGSTRPS